MGRNLLVNDEDLIARLSQAFREYGYEGASLAILSRVTGLKKASLYHRFPEGKEQMAREVLQSTRIWLDENVLAALQSAGAPEARIGMMVRKLDELYSGGRQACILNLLSSTSLREGPFTRLIKDVFDAWIGGLSTALVDAGLDPDIARMRAERAVILIQGGLVLSRGVGDTRHFRQVLSQLSAELLATS